MMSQFSVLDETMCRAPVCQHPQCWMTFGRLERGVARYRPLEESSEPLLDEEEWLPVLTVCNLSKPQPPASGRHIYVPASPSSFDAAQAPGMKESQQSQSRKRLPASKMLTKVGLVDVSLGPAGSQDIQNRETSLVWIPNSQYRRVKPAQEEGFTGEEPLKIGIKDFTLESEACGNEKSKERNRTAQKPRKGKKLPTRRNLNLSLRGGPAPPRGSTKNRISASSEEERNEETSENMRAVCGQYPRTWCLQLPIPKFPKPENRRLVLHDAKEKTQQSATSPVPPPVYKLDDKFPGILSVKEVDLESIRNQYYLWKKYSFLADSSGRISTSALDQQTKICQVSRAATGLMALRMMGNIGLFPCDPQSELSLHMDLEAKDSVRSNTAQSCDASFGSFSPSPRTDPDSQAVQGSSPEPLCYEDTAEPAQGLVKGSTVMDFCMGPTIAHHMILADYFDEIYLLDSSDTNLQEVTRWLNDEDGAMDWSHSAMFACELKNERALWKEQQEKVRRAIKQVLKYDFAADKPLGSATLPPVDCVFTAFYLGVISKDFDGYVRNMKNICSFVKVGGCLVLFFTVNMSFYTLNQQKFPVVKVSEQSVKKALRDIGFNIELWETYESKLNSPLYDHEYLVSAVARKYRQA